MKLVPFVPNRQDSTHSAPAVFRMLYQYFYTEDPSWGEIERILSVSEDNKRGVWPLLGEIELAKKGLTVMDIGPIDPSRLYWERDQYLKSLYGEESALDYIRRSNIHDIIDALPEYMVFIKYEVRAANFEDLRKLIAEDNICAVELNMSALDKHPHFKPHMTLVYDIEGQEVVFHDPGPPPHQAMRLSIDDFCKCWMYDPINASLSAFKNEHEAK